MDLIKQELEKKRQALAESTGGRKIFKRVDIEQKRLQKLREEEQKELQSKQNRHSNSAAGTSSAAATSSTSLNSNSSKSNPESSAKTLTLGADEKKIDDLDLPRPEVIRRLRLLKQPVTLFGEDDDARLERLKFVLKAGMFEVDNDMTDGQTNDFLRDIVELKKRQKSGMMSERKRKSEDLEDGEDGNGGDDDLSGDGASDGVDADKDLKRMKANFDELCDEDKILVFFKKLLNEWNQELREMGEAERRTAKGKQMVATCKQCARYLTPLFKFCRKKVSDRFTFGFRFYVFLWIWSVLIFSGARIRSTS